jgi:hypothetical protein
MPCNDVTEVLELTLDADDRLVDYAFAKRSCGQAVGAAGLLMDQIGGFSAEELVAMDAEDFLARFPIADELEEFLSLKHFFAVQGGIEVYLGRESGGPNDFFACSGIDYDGGAVRVHGRIGVDLVTEKIKSCGGCKGCGKSSRTPVAAADA